MFAPYFAGQIRIMDCLVCYSPFDALRYARVVFSRGHFTKCSVLQYLSNTSFSGWYFPSRAGICGFAKHTSFRKNIHCIFVSCYYLVVLSLNIFNGTWLKTKSRLILKNNYILVVRQLFHYQIK